MPIVPNFSTSQTFGSPSKVTLQDTSTGSDGSLVERRVFLRKADGVFLVPEGNSTQYIVWDYAVSTITIDALDKDYGLDIVVQWLDFNFTVLYDKTIATGLTLYNETYDDGLTQKFSGNPLLINDDGYFERKSRIRTDIDSGNQAIVFAEDLFAAQQCYNDATNVRLNYP